MVGGAVLFAAVLLMFMMAFDEKMSRTLGGEKGMVALLIIGFTFGPTVMALSKRLFLRLFKMSSGWRARVFSFASSFAVVFVSVGISVLLGFLLSRRR